MTLRQRIFATAGACCLLFTIVGCESDAQVRAKYDRWFPPDSRRDQVIARHGEPFWTTRRPATNPSNAQWHAAVKTRFWFNPDWLVWHIGDVERRSGREVHRVDTYLRNERFLASDVDVIYYNENDRVITSADGSYLFSD